MNTPENENVFWWEYDVNWLALAKSSCRLCHGRGIEGYMVQTKEEEARGDEPIAMLCSCVSLKWKKLTDAERMQYATRKPDADKITDDAREEVKKLIEQVKAENPSL
jgi:hypothetical protein